MKKMLKTLLLSSIFGCFGSQNKDVIKEPNRETVNGTKPRNSSNKNNFPGVVFSKEYFNNENIKLCKEKFENFALFKVKERKSGLELYIKDEDFLGIPFTIACFDKNDKILFNKKNKGLEIHNDVKTSSLIQPLGVHKLEDKNLHELKNAAEKFSKDQLAKQAVARTKGNEVEDSMSIVGGETSYILIECKGNYYIEYIKKVNAPNLRKFSFGKISPSNLNLIMEWEEVPNTFGYELKVQCSNENGALEYTTQKIVKKSSVEFSVSKEFSSFEIIKLVACNDSFESSNFENNLGLETEISLISKTNLTLVENFNNFLEAYNLKLAEHIKNELLSYESIKKMFIERDGKLDFLKYLIMNLDPSFKRIEILDIEDYNSSRLKGILSRKQELLLTNEKIFEYYKKVIREVYNSVKEDKIKLFKNMESTEVKDYTLDSYISNFILALSLALNIDENHTREALKAWGIRDIKTTSYIRPDNTTALGVELVNATLLSGENKISISFYIKEIYSLLQSTTLTQEDKVESLITLIEGFTHCIPGIYERLAFVSNNLNKIVTNNSSTTLEETVEFNLLSYREQLLIEVGTSLSKKSENVMYFENLRKNLHLPLKIRPAGTNKNFQLNAWNISSDNKVKFISDFNKKYKKKAFLKISNDFNKYKEKFLPIIKEFLKNKLSSCIDYKEETEYLADFFSRNFGNKKEKIKEGFVKALFLEMGVAKID